MQSSDELKKLIIQLYKNEASGRIFDFARHLYSRQEGTLLIGSEPGDRYEGYDAIIHFYKEAGTVALEIIVDEIDAYTEGAFGWAVDHVTARLPNGTEIPVRHTYIFNLEEGGWRIIHAHISVGVLDENLGT